MKSFPCFCLIATGLLGLAFGSIGNRSMAQLSPAIPPALPGAMAGPFYFGTNDVTWTGFSIIKTNEVSVPVAMDYTTAEGIHITNGVRKTLMFAQYELGIRSDGVLIVRKVGP